MRRVLFVSIALLTLLVPATALAGEPVNLAPDQVPPVAQLGEVWFFWTDPGFFLPFERVDTYLYRPATWDWPWDFCQDAALNNVPCWGTWYWSGWDSEQRRQSWPTFAYANDWGQYFSAFMLPRDEVWYPCSYPYKWNCNYVVYPGDPVTYPVVEWHSPAYQGNFECRVAGIWIECLEWPWFDWTVLDAGGTVDEAFAWANPMDTVSPLVVTIVGETGAGGWLPMEVDGYYWKWSDLEDDWYPVTMP